MKIIKAHRSKYGHYYVMFDEIPEKTYRKEGCNFIGTARDENGNVISSYYLKKGPKGAFAGRELILDMEDGTQETIKDYWWDVGHYPEHGEFINIGASTLEELQKCYVYYSFNINKVTFQKMLDEFLAEKEFESYKEIENWVNDQYEWYPVKVHGKELPLLANYHGHFIDPETRERMTGKTTLWRRKGGKNYYLHLFRFSYMEGDRLCKIEASMKQVIKETFPADIKTEICTEPFLP